MNKVVFVALIEKINNKHLYNLYLKEVVKIIQSYNGEYLVRSEKITKYSGEKPDRVIIISFNSMKDAKDCFYSKEYELIKDLREKSTKSRAFFIEND